MIALVLILSGMYLDISKPDYRLNLNNLRLHCNINDWGRYGFFSEMYSKKQYAISMYNYPITITYDWDTQVFCDLHFDRSRLSQLVHLRKMKDLQGEWNIVGFDLYPSRHVLCPLLTKCIVKNDVILMKLFVDAEWILKTKTANIHDFYFALPAPLTLASDSTIGGWVGIRLLQKTKNKLYFQSLSSASGPHFWIFTKDED